MKTHAYASTHGCTHNTCTNKHTHTSPQRHTNTLLAPFPATAEPKISERPEGLEVSAGCVHVCRNTQPALWTFMCAELCACAFKRGVEVKLHVLAELHRGIPPQSCRRPLLSTHLAPFPWRPAEGGQNGCILGRHWTLCSLPTGTSEGCLRERMN